MSAQWIDFKTLKQKLNFEDVLATYGTEVKTRKGDQLTVLCPFHEDSKPSCGINIKKNQFNCFSCNTSGNILDFIVLSEGLDPDNNADIRKAALDAVKTYGIQGASRKKQNKKPKSGHNKPDKAEKSPVRAKTVKNDEIPEEPLETLSQGVSEDENSEGPEITENKVLDFELQVKTNHPFLKSRKVPKAVLQEFGIGYCGRGIMRGRIVFPIHNAQGELVANSGRWAEEPVPEDQIKYKLPKNFLKSLELFNIHRVAVHKPKTVVLVEGYWSVLRLHQQGVPVVGLMGTSISDQQVQLLMQSGIRAAIVIMDGDDAGRKGAEDVVFSLSKEFYVRRIDLPEGVKPDTMSIDTVNALPHHTK